MKLAILNDTHCGARNSSNIFIEYQERFYKEVFFPYCIENNIRNILHGGDYYDHRKFINFKALDSNNKVFLDRLREEGMTMDIIPGNHDEYYKNTNMLCSLPILMQAYNDVVNIHMDPTILTFDDVDIAMIPWITNDNYDQVMNFVKYHDANLCFGHFEFAGFDLYPGTPAQSGMNPSLFSKYPLVISGHYHTRSENANVKYLGAQMEFTWADCNDPKYFHVYDTETQTLTPIRNHLTLFEKITYNDTKFDYEHFDYSICDNKFVKLIVENRKDQFTFEQVVDNIQQRSIHDLKIVENFEDIHDEALQEDLVFEDTIDLLSEYVNVLDTHLDKTNLNHKLRSLYVQAQQAEYM